MLHRRPLLRTQARPLRQHPRHNLVPDEVALVLPGVGSAQHPPLRLDYLRARVHRLARGRAPDRDHAAVPAQPLHLFQDGVCPGLALQRLRDPAHERALLHDRLRRQRLGEAGLGQVLHPLGRRTHPRRADPIGRDPHALKYGRARPAGLDELALPLRLQGGQRRLPIFARPRTVSGGLGRHTILGGVEPPLPCSRLDRRAPLGEQLQHRLGHPGDLEVAPGPHRLVTQLRPQGAGQLAPVQRRDPAGVLQDRAVVEAPGRAIGSHA